MIALLNPYTDAASVAAEIKNSKVSDTDMTRAINEASRFVDNYMRRNFYETDYIDTPLVLNQFSKDILADTIFFDGPVIELVSLTRNDVVLVQDTDFCLIQPKPYEVGGAQLCKITGTWQEKIRGGEWLANAPSNQIIFTGRIGYSQVVSGTLDRTTIPQGMPPHIGLATKLIAAALTGMNTRDHVGLDGVRTAINDRNIPKTALDILGRRQPLLT